MGKFTCYNYNGSSVVDYLLNSYDNFDSISSFSVGDLTEFSKHVPITFNVNHGLDIELRNINSSHKYITWSCDKKEEYTHTLENHLIQLRNIVNQTNSTDCEIDRVIKGFTDVLYDASFSVFGKEFKCKSEKDVRIVLGLTRTVKHVKLISNVRLLYIYVFLLKTTEMICYVLKGAILNLLKRQK